MTIYILKHLIEGICYLLSIKIQKNCWLHSIEFQYRNNYEEFERTALESTR